MVEDIRNVITCFKFGDDRFRGLASAEGQILPFPIDFDGRPYNTLTLPCERVIFGHKATVTLEETVLESSIFRYVSELVNGQSYQHCLSGLQRSDDLYRGQPTSGIIGIIGTGIIVHWNTGNCIGSVSVSI